MIRDALDGRSNPYLTDAHDVQIAFTAAGQSLSRSYGRLFAEFLDEDSLVHLGLLDLSTCVGLRYGRL